MFKLKFLAVSCFFLLSAAFAGNPNREFSVDKNEIPQGGIVTFDASGIRSAKKILWSFGDGGSVVTTNSIISYQYKSAGTFSASLKYQVNASDKNPNYKEAGSTSILVKNSAPKPNQAPVASLACSVNNLLVSCSGLSSYDPENQPLVFTFDYGDGFSETNTTAISTHAYASAGLYSAKLYVYDSAGANSVAEVQVQPVTPPNVLPSLALNCSSPQINTLVCDAIGSQDTDGAIVSYSFSWDDGSTETQANFSSVTHVFSDSGNHTVTLSAVDNDGGMATLTKSFAVKANTNPVASFSCDNSKPLKLVCNSTSTDVDQGDVIQSYVWKFGAVSEFTTYSGSAEYTFNSAGQIEVSLTVIDSYGGKNSFSHLVEVKANQLPTFDFIADKTSGFAPLTVHFSLKNAQDSDGVVTNYKIDFGDETSSGSNVVDHTFNTPGAYNVSATVTDDFGEETTKIIPIEVKALIKNPPQAYFKIFEFDTWGELHATLTKTQYDIKRAFYTIDGSEIVELSEFYPNTINWVDLKNYGHHEITLTVEDIYGQKSSFTHSFEQVEDLEILKPYVDFSAKQSAARTVFVNLNRAFDFDIDQPIQSFHIDFGDGHAIDSTDLYATYSYVSAGTYPITVTAFTAHRTQNSKTKEIVITDEVTPILEPTANFGYRIYDFAQNVSFYNDKSGTPNGTIISYVWDFGDGTTGVGAKVSHFYEPGMYFVKLTVVDSAGQTSSQTQHVTIFGTGSDLIAQVFCDIVDPYVELPQTCQVFALDRLNQITRVRVTWGDGGVNNLTLPSVNGIFRPSHKYANVGNYPVNLTVTTSRGEIKTASTSISLVNFVPSTPTAVLNCTQDLMTVTCSSVGSYDSKYKTLSYTFNWGDGSSETTVESIISHVYSSESTYQVALTATNSAGYSGSAVKDVSVFKTSLRASLYCETNNLLVTCNSFGSWDVNGNEPLVFKYDFGDGFIVTTENYLASHSYLTAGVFTVKLEVMNSVGQVSTLETNVMPLVPPNQLPIPYLACTSPAPFTVNCDDSASIDYDGTVFSYRIIWNDGTEEIFGSSGTIEHRFEQSGTHIVQLELTDNDGGKSNISKSVDVLINNPPIAKFVCTTPGPQRIHCDSLSQENDYGDQIVTYEWNLGDGKIVKTFIPSVDYTYDQASTYTILLDVFDSFGSHATTSQEITTLENLPPQANITCISTLGFAYQCDSNASDNDGRIVKEEWEIDGKFLSGSSIIYNFATGGDYLVKYTATDDLGKQSSYTIKIHIDKPEVAINCEQFDYHVKCSFYNLNDLKTIALYQYEIDNSKIYSTQIMEHDFAVSGNHVIRLIVKATDGTQSVYEKNLIVEKKNLSPKAAFTSFADIYLRVNFDAKESYFQERSVVKFTWDFGDETIESTSESSISHTFSKNGNFTVKLTVEDKLGETNTFSKSIAVYYSDVSAPGLSNEESLNGIDSDNDGIRDDVQRWINFESRGDEIKKSLLRKMASYHQQMLDHRTEGEILKLLLESNFKVSSCLHSKLANDDEADFYVRMLKYLYRSTEERHRAWNEVEQNSISISIPLIPNDESERAVSCEGII